MAKTHSQLVFLAFLGPAACAGGPAIEDPLASLTVAEDQLQRGDAEAASELLEALGEDSFAGVDRERFLVRQAQAWSRTGYPWDAFELIRDFADDHAFSPYINEVQDLEYALGSALIKSNGGFLFFTSDAVDGRVILEHFTLRWPKHPATSDALRLLGEQAYEDGDYQRARQRFSDLVLRHENSEWVTLARFRIAMSSFKILIGPAYDIESLRRAHNELRDFLSIRIENPQFLAEASTAFEAVREWLGQKHQKIADFYDTIGNSLGALHHLEMAATNFPDTESGRDAAVRLKARRADAQEAGS